ncbi:MAG: hypothetical protein SF339_14200 [Blastocatellia bacterium]|nr:hypothetical protein [Blastocatellia bacterium]
MFKDVIQAIGGAARKLFSNWGALLISFALYAALIGVLYLFFTTREATMTQVVLSVAILPLAAILLFFSLQGMGISYVRIGVGALYQFKRALRDSWLLLVISLPLLALCWAFVHYVGDPDPKLMNPWIESRAWLRETVWALWYPLLYVIFPLIAIHWWIAAAREGLGGALKGTARNIGRALSPRSVLIYLLNIAVFGAGAYFLFFTKIHLKSEWGELWLFGARFALGLVLVFLGWMLTLGAMAEMTARRAIGELEG